VKPKLVTTVGGDKAKKYIMSNKWSNDKSNIYEAVRQNIFSRRSITTFTCRTYRKYCLLYVQVTPLFLNNKEAENICTVDSTNLKVDKEVRLVKAVNRMNCSVYTEEKRMCFWQPLNYQLTECTKDFLNFCIYRRH